MEVAALGRPITGIPPAPGPFSADCANAALREELKKLYGAMHKNVAAKEGACPGRRRRQPPLVATYIGPRGERWGGNELEASSTGAPLSP